jgi:hypothetical protein
MKSSLVSRLSALVLAIEGGTLLFAPDAVLPRLISPFPTSGIWIGQWLAAAWLGMAVLNWHSRGLVLGGIYGRPVVLANFATYFLTASSSLQLLGQEGLPKWFKGVVVVNCILAALYSWLLLKGPFAADFERP